MASRVLFELAKTCRHQADMVDADNHSELKNDSEMEEEPR